MKKLVADTNSASLEASELESILTDWLATITDFHHNYQQVASCINQKTIDQALNSGNTAYIGQCPINLLLELISAMQRTLKRLGQDLDQLDHLRPSCIAQNYKKLKGHTRILKRLNQQAQNRLYLVALPSS